MKSPHLYQAPKNNSFPTNSSEWVYRDLTPKRQGGSRTRLTMPIPSSWLEAQPVTEYLGPWHCYLNFFFKNGEWRWVERYLSTCGSCREPSLGFPAPTWWFITIHNSNSWEFNAFFWTTSSICVWDTKIQAKQSCI